jgi:hypothetical protein
MKNFLDRKNLINFIIVTIGFISGIITIIAYFYGGNTDINTEVPLNACQVENNFVHIFD